MADEKEQQISWLTVVAAMLSGLWVLFAVGIGAYVVEVVVPQTYEYAYVMRDGVQVTHGEAARPLYDLIVPPAQSGRAAEFVRVGRFRPYIATHEQPRVEHRSPDGTSLMVSQQLTAPDQAFVKDAFDGQRWARRWFWLQVMAGYLAVVVLPPLFLFGAIRLGRRFIAETAEAPPPSPPTSAPPSA